MTPTPPGPTRLMSAVDLLAVAFQALSDEEQTDALRRLSELRLVREAGEESETARLVRSLARAAELVGTDLAPADYNTVRERLREGGEELEPMSRITRHFGSWRRAKEALLLTETTTPRRIEARFRSRRLGKVWRYTEETLEETLRRCVADIGHVPQVAEFDWWRERELELARAEGNDALHLPSATPYRKRWKTWADALRHFGYSEAEIEGRLERP